MFKNVKYLFMCVYLYVCNNTLVFSLTCSEDCTLMKRSGQVIDAATSLSSQRSSRRSSCGVASRGIITGGRGG